MSSEGVNGVYDIIRINKALDDLGMLSTTTTSRKEYLQECLRDSMEKLNVDQAGPSTSRWDSQLPSKTPGSSDATEKENTNIGGFQILKMNSAFITSFTAGYELPCHGVKERLAKRVYKCCFARRRRLRTHPYDGSTTNTIASVSEPSNSPGGSYRLRTTSLSSGTGKNKSNSGYSSVSIINNNKNSSSTNPVLVRSRSMENLSASMDEGLILTSRPKELETVSRGIQELRMDDTT